MFVNRYLSNRPSLYYTYLNGARLSDLSLPVELAPDIPVSLLIFVLSAGCDRQTHPISIPRHGLATDCGLVY